MARATKSNALAALDDLKPLTSCQAKKLFPAIPVTSKYFKYTPSYATDIKKKFEDIRTQKASVEGAVHYDDAEFIEKMFDFIPPLAPTTLPPPVVSKLTIQPGESE